MSRKYKFSDPEGIYFISTATVYWLDIFVRRLYKDIVIERLKYCSKEKGLVINGYVIMSNHIHLLISKKPGEDSFSDIIRDFKKYIAMQIIKLIIDTK